LTKTFETETEAKNFARIKFEEGLIVTAGTINLVCQDKRSRRPASRLDLAQDQETADPDCAEQLKKDVE
jgi:hypothetical protein